MGSSPKGSGSVGAGIDGIFSYDCQQVIKIAPLAQLLYMIQTLVDEGEVLVNHTYLKRRYPMKVKSKVQAGGKAPPLNLMKISK